MSNARGERDGRSMAIPADIVQPPHRVSVPECPRRPVQANPHIAGVDVCVRIRYF